MTVFEGIMVEIYISKEVPFLQLITSRFHCREDVFYFQLINALNGFRESIVPGLGRFKV